MTPPTLPLPRVRVSTKALRSRLSATACRRSASLKGGASRFIITLRLTFTGTSSQIASGAWFFTSVTTGTCKKYGEVMYKQKMEEHTSELQSHSDIVCRLLLEKKKKNYDQNTNR